MQSAHCQRLRGGATPRAQIAMLDQALVAQSSSVGAHIGQAVALAEAGDLAAGMAVLAAMPAERVRSHQPYWMALAHLQRLAGQKQPGRRAAGPRSDSRRSGAGVSAPVAQRVMQSASGSAPRTRGTGDHARGAAPDTPRCRAA